MANAEPEPVSSAMPPSIASTQDDRTMAMLAHLGGIVTGFVVPLVIWLMKKDQSPFVDDQGKEALNFQINVFGQAMILSVFAAVTCGIGAILILPWLLWPIIMPIIGGLAANKGDVYRYPLTIRVIK
jgi:uncharacterized Tic20 family protein